MVSLGSQRHGEITHTTGVLGWRGAGPLGRTGWEGEEGELAFVWESSRKAQSSAWGWAMSQLRSKGSGLVGKPMCVMLWWVPAKHLLIGKRSR